MPPDSQPVQAAIQKPLHGVKSCRGFSFLPIFNCGTEYLYASELAQNQRNNEPAVPGRRNDYLCTEVSHCCALRAVLRTVAPAQSWGPGAGRGIPVNPPFGLPLLRQPPGSAARCTHRIGCHRCPTGKQAGLPFLQRWLRPQRC